MSLIDITYFDGSELNIPNTDKLEVQELVTTIITKYEDDFLRRLMGYPLYKAFMAGLPVTAGTPQRIIDLVNGKEYTSLQGFLTQYRGLLITEPAQMSPIANYIYYWYRRLNATQFTGIGEVMTTAENSTNQSPNQKMATAWNEMCRWVWEFVLFMDTNLALNPGLYPEWIWIYRWETIRYFEYSNPIF